ncbi:hypothetical protein F4679DRAFT_489166 [Xylaria curta]|nr:hypothetical protein F4679DRAFT_489166 [Xylaria curta]
MASESTVARGIDPTSNIAIMDPASNNDDNDMGTVVMHMSTTRIAGSRMQKRTSVGGKVAFTFQIEAGSGSEKRNDVFSWIRRAKKDEAGIEKCGYTLVQHPRKPRQQPGTVDRRWSAHDMRDEDKVIAILSYEKQWPSSSSAPFRHMFEIQFTDEATPMYLGDNLARSIFVTACFLRTLEIIGRAGE